MKVKDLIKIQHAIIDAKDFIASNGDGDETDLTDNQLAELNKCDLLLDKEINRIYLKNAKQKLKNKRKNQKPWMTYKKLKEQINQV